MKKFSRLLVLCGAAALVAGCATPTEPSPVIFNKTPVPQEEESDITQVRVAILRELLKDHPPEAWAFLSNGRGEGPAYASVTREVFSQLSDLKIKMLPVSMAKPPRLGDGGRILHRDTGEPGYIYTAVISEWNGPNVAMVQGQKFDGAVPVAGFTAAVQRVPNLTGGSTWKLSNIHVWQEQK